MSIFHIPVLLNEVIEYLNIQEGEVYVDCNIGGGGHSEEIIKRGGKVVGIDLDAEAIKEAAAKFKVQVTQSEEGLFGESEDIILVQDNFIHLKDIIFRLKVGKVKGVLLDLGISSHQLETGERGFSFQSNAPLDMRMNQNSDLATAADLVNGLHEGELTELFTKLGEEPMARLIAKKIVEIRKINPIKNTKQLAQVVEYVKFKNIGSKLHPATQVFQALRIAVNDELNSLKNVLPSSFDILDKDGRLVCISFHSLEDRIVKSYFKDIEEKKLVRILTNKPVEASSEEIMINPRARSAKLRALEKGGQESEIIR
jgi:16S rRNA (cytosine1402-N4)-methyltransferase